MENQENRFPFDSALMPLSALDHFMLSFTEEFLPVANAKGVATIAMKVLGLGSLTHEVERSLRYAFSLPVSTVIVGMETMAQLEQNLEIAESFTPMTDEERLAFFKDIIPLVQPGKMRWKAPDWDNPTEWVPRRRGNLTTCKKNQIALSRRTFLAMTLPFLDQIRISNLDHVELKHPLCSGDLLDFCLHISRALL